MRAAPHLRLLRGTGRMQWVSTELETTRDDGLVLRVNKQPATSMFAGEWDAVLTVPMPTADNRYRKATHFVSGLYSSPDAAMDAAERCAACIGDVRAVLAFLEAAPVLARLWWGRR
jgi:hypothetical protein